MDKKPLKSISRNVSIKEKVISHLCYNIDFKISGFKLEMRGMPSYFPSVTQKCMPSNKCYMYSVSSVNATLAVASNPGEVYALKTIGLIFIIYLLRNILTF